MIVGAIASAVAASLFDGRTAVAMAATMTVCAFGAVCVYGFVVRPAERRSGKKDGSSRNNSASYAAAAA
ncbi:MAG: hypothetical protein ABJE47_17610 [bacterium]